MFCISLKSMRCRIWMLAAALVFAAAVILIVSAAGRVFAAPTSADLSGSTQEQRLQFLHAYGWTVCEDPVSVDDVFIPQQFGEVYNSYNEIQIQQGFDLLPYAGKQVKRWVYAVTNYPGYADSAVFVRATILICGGTIIGGDVCSVELNGFMHGFVFKR